MKPVIKTILILLLIIHVSNVFGSGLTDTTKKDTTTKKASVKFGVDYDSNDVFMGRSNKTDIPIISPNIKYTFKPGIYIGGTLDYLPNNAKNKVDGGDIDAGYEFDITDDLSGDVSYTKLFYNTNSNQIASSITSIINANFDYDIGDIITPSISADYDVNKAGINDDIFLNFGISHDIIFEKLFGSHDFIFISPTAGFNAGTQNFYDAFLQKKVFKNAKRTAAQNKLIDEFEAGVDQFKMLDYELSIPIEYKAGHFIFQFTPEYDIVENAFKANSVSKTLGVSTSPSVFYFTTGIAFKF
jgi:hypothetical protein